MVFGFGPAFLQHKRPIHVVLQRGGRWGTGGGGTVQAGLVACELALTVVLLITGGLLARSLGELGRVDPGFDARGVATVRVQSEGHFGSDHEARLDGTRRLRREVLDRVRAIPGVLHAGAIDKLPFPGRLTGTSFQVEGTDGKEPQSVTARSVECPSPGYFDAMGIPLLAGRDFTDADGEEGADEVYIINETMAREFLAGGSPLRGQHRRRLRPLSDYRGGRRRKGRGTWRRSPLPWSTGRLLSPPATSASRRGRTGTRRAWCLSCERLSGRRTPASPSLREPPWRPLSPYRRARSASGRSWSRPSDSWQPFWPWWACSASPPGPWPTAHGSWVSARRWGAQGGRLVLMMALSTLRAGGLGIVVGVVGALVIARLLPSFLFGVQPWDVGIFAGTVLLLVSLGVGATIVAAGRVVRWSLCGC